MFFSKMERMCRFFWQYLVVSLIFMLSHNAICSSSPSPSKLCSPDQSLALLNFKNFFSIADVPSLKTESWKEGSDCCSWDGVTCDTLTGHVIGLDLSCSRLRGTLYPNSTLFHLHHLRKLNLAYNDFGASEISSMFGHLTKLTHLNLSLSFFHGPVPPEISYLSSLVSLDLSTGWVGSDLRLDQHSFDKLSQNLTKLRGVVLDGVNMSSIAPCSLVNLSSSLVSLHLTSTGLHGKFPNDVFRFPFLEQLVLSWNGPFIGHLPKSNWSSPLRLLDLSGTALYGDVIGDHIYLPEALFNLTRLTYLDLSRSGFTGRIPVSVSNLGKLTYLSLSGNDFSGQLPSSIFNLTQLSLMYLFGNQLEGYLPSQVRGLPYLIGLDLHDNLRSGRLPSWLLALPSLLFLRLEDNKFTGPIDPLEQPSPLKQVDLSNNFFSGIVNSDMFSKLINLESVDFSHNPLLSLRSYSNFNFTLPNLTSFRFSSCNISEIPIFLRNSKKLGSLDLSDNSIHSQISQEELELWPFLTYLDLHSNLLQGPLVVPPPTTNMLFFSVSDNRLTGEIPSSICNMSSIQYLVLANNSFSGMIPECLGNYEGLEVLDLKMNNFHGSIPQTFGNGISLQTINLNGNQLKGPLSTSLVNCSSLEVLDVGNNMINDTFPDWLASLEILQVLILRSNRFHGYIGNSETRSPFSMLRILDVAHNEFIGLLPTNLFESFESMMNSDDNGDDNSTSAVYMGSDYYLDSVALTWKGSEVQMDRILTILTAMDLSSNQFEGQIPEVVGELNLLKVLNLSHNSLTGQIPSSLRNMTQLESLDLSSNRLAGGIPMQLTSLTFLSVLNLSYNWLVGPIPQGKQFDTFEYNSYIGNLGFCGPPLLSKKCVKDEAPEPILQPSEEEDTWRWFDWKIIMMGYGSGLVIGLSIGYMVFSTGKPHWFVKLFNRDGPRKARKISRSHQRRN